MGNLASRLADANTSETEEATHAQAPSNSLHTPAQPPSIQPESHTAPSTCAASIPGQSQQQQQQGEIQHAAPELESNMHRDVESGGENQPLLSGKQRLVIPAAPPTANEKSTASSDSSNNTSSSSNSPKDQDGKKEETPARICRICFDSEEEADNPLIHPCLCQGSHGSVHRKCLQTWRDTQRASLHSQAYFRCEICHYEYQYVRLDSAACIAHPAVVATVFLFMLLLTCTFLGIVPIIQACLEAYEINFEGWLHVLVHLCDGLLVMGLVSVVMVACTSPQLARMQPARLGYNCSLIMCWCRIVGCGQVCGPIWLASLAVLAFLGLINSLPVAFMILYHIARVLTGATVRMVENVDPDEARAHKARASRAAAQQLPLLPQQPQQQQQQQQSGVSFTDAGLAV